MDLVVWTPQLAVGIAVIDEQHKKLIALINTLHQSCQKGGGEKVVGTALIEMVDYAKVHFRTEESLIRAAGYPEVAQHRGEHDAFTGRLKELAGGFLAGDPSTAEQMLAYLKVWLVDHISHSDQRYAEFIRARGLKV